jgi:putative transcriptional regulator
VLGKKSNKKEVVSNRVKEFREERGLTQQDLASRAGVSRQSIISIERGRYIPSLPLALIMARIFECSADDLFHLEGKQNG